MKVGDLVRCIWQPGSSGVYDGYAQPMVHAIKGQVGIVRRVVKDQWAVVMFPGCGGYTHQLSSGAFEVLNESR